MQELSDSIKPENPGHWRKRRGASQIDT
jgi:hypothetical protein